MNRQITAVFDTGGWRLRIKGEFDTLGYDLVYGATFEELMRNAISTGLVRPPIMVGLIEEER